MHPSTLPSLVFADSKGNITDFAPLTMAGMSNGHILPPQLDELIPLPEGSELFLLPLRFPVGLDPDTGEAFLVDKNPYDTAGGVQAVAAFMAPAYTTILTSAFKKADRHAPTLPLFAYSAVGWYENNFWVAGFRSDNDIRQDANQFDLKIIERKTHEILKRKTSNRLIQHLGKCCLTYCCPAARNYFLGRWEAPLPTSPQCNARCIGCISLQSSGCCPSTQERITFVPSVKEISELAVDHLLHADKPIVSFGQGCEGEPLLQADTIEKAIRHIRRETSVGTINLNSNASLPRSVKKLAIYGLDSLRVSLNSAQKEYYEHYYKPVNYSFADVLASICEMKAENKFVSLNYFVMPGFTDTSQELESLCELIETCSPDFIQLRNLNMDPDLYFKSIKFPSKEQGMGILTWKNKLKTLYPSIGLGYFNPEV